MSNVLVVYCVRHVDTRTDMDSGGGRIGIGRASVGCPGEFSGPVGQRRRGE